MSYKWTYFDTDQYYEKYNTRELGKKTPIHFFKREASIADILPEG